MAALENVVEQGPDPERDGIVRWRRIDLQALIKARFDVSLHERSVGKLLHRLGFARLSVRPKHPSSNLEAQAAFKKAFPSWCRQRYPSTLPASRSRSGFKTRPEWANKAP
jgi:transposase